MRTFISIIAVLLFLNGNLNTSKAQKNEKRSLTNPLTMKEVRQVIKRIPRLKQGMSPEQVRVFLGLDRYDIIREGSGPLDDYRVIYHLRSGYTLLLIYDLSAGVPGEYKRAVLLKSRKATLPLRIPNLWCYEQRVPALAADRNQRDSHR